jgi:hypothetical protein
MTARVERLPESPDNPFRLGRHIEHDEASKAYPAQLAIGGACDVSHTAKTPVLDQGNLGSCTGNAITKLLGTEPRRLQTITLNEVLAVSIYAQATAEDPYPGTYPPDDTGSSGLAVAKVAQERGLIAGYDHAFGLHDTLLALTLRPVIVGIPWYDSMFYPDDGGWVTITPNAVVVGGHELCLDAIRLAPQAVGFPNSWGPTWGRKGRGRMSFATLDRLLTEGGDCTVPRYS